MERLAAVLDVPVAYFYAVEDDVAAVSVKVVDASSFKLFMLLGAPCLVG